MSREDTMERNGGEVWLFVLKIKVERPESWKEWVLSDSRTKANLEGIKKWVNVPWSCCQCLRLQCLF